MRRYSNPTHRALIHLCYLLPAIFGILLLIYAAVPHLWFVYNGDAYSTMNLFELQENAWGFYDMLGNAAEFCLDYTKLSNFPEEAIDPVGPSASESGTSRIRRGGTSGDGTSANCRCAHRSYTSQGASYYYNGFRVMCPITLKW